MTQIKRCYDRRITTSLHFPHSPSFYKSNQNGRCNRHNLLPAVRSQRSLLAHACRPLEGFKPHYYYCLSTLIVDILWHRQHYCLSSWPSAPRETCSECDVCRRCMACWLQNLCGIRSAHVCTHCIGVCFQPSPPASFLSTGGRDSTI